MMQRQNCVFVSDNSGCYFQHNWHSLQKNIILQSIKHIWYCRQTNPKRRALGRALRRIQFKGIQGWNFKKCVVTPSSLRNHRFTLTRNDIFLDTLYYIPFKTKVKLFVLNINDFFHITMHTIFTNKDYLNM